MEEAYHKETIKKLTKNMQNSGKEQASWHRNVDENLECK